MKMNIMDIKNCKEIKSVFEAIDDFFSNDKEGMERVNHAIDTYHISKLKKELEEEKNKK